MASVSTATTAASRRGSRAPRAAPRRPRRRRGRSPRRRSVAAGAAPRPRGAARQWVRFAGRSERLLDAEVDLQVTPAEPAAAARGQHWRLVELLHAKGVAPEGPALRLAVAGDRELHVVDRQQREAERVVDGAGVVHGLDSLLAQDAPVSGDLEVDGVQVAAQQVHACADRRVVLGRSVSSSPCHHQGSETTRGSRAHPSDHPRYSTHCLLRGGRWMDGDGIRTTDF
jgi:hypothetical protein